MGVFTTQDELIGFAYGFAGRDRDGTEFHYSQAATVDPRFQGRGVGRTLKLLQAEVASSGVTAPCGGPLTHPRAQRSLQSSRSVRWGSAICPTTTHGRAPTESSSSGNCAAGTGPYAPSATPSRPRSAAPTGGASPGTLATADGGTHVRVDRDPRGGAGATADTTRRKPLATLSEAGSRCLRLLDGRVLVGCTRINDDTAAYLAVPRRRPGKDIA